MFRVPLATGSFPLTRDQFWSAILLYHTSPHLVNRRVLGVTQLSFLEVEIKNEVFKLNDILNYSELQSQINRILPISSENVNDTIITNILEINGSNFTYERKNFDDIKNSDFGYFVSVRILLPRSPKAGKCVEIVLIDKANNMVTFSPISEHTEIYISPTFSYEVELDQNNTMKVCVGNIDTAELKASEWLADYLFPKLQSWAEKANDDLLQQKSLSLLSVEEYCHVYHELKLKYGKKMMKIWPENTDPKKFVYEDIAIATYLLLLWKQTTGGKQTYVDLGCGNGLLVYILNEEGHCGYGIDVRPRKIWSLYPETTILKVQTIIPSSTTIFPDADWLIGNHSDELTPWIPVMAARSSNNCKFFLLPCCSFEFNGKKYQRVDSSRSQYSEYLDYIKKISETCGFNCEIDRLRIPSTKRTCLVGRTKINENFGDVDKKITDLINERCKKENKNWVDDYEARKEIEIVRNCTKLDKSLVNNIVSKVICILLSTQNYLTTVAGEKWNSGGHIVLPDLVKLIPAIELKQLKKECGGLQTLLKNHHYIFQVINGKVKLRVPSISRKVLTRAKTKECWFYKNHPDGCFLDSINCLYLHSEIKSSNR